MLYYDICLFIPLVSRPGCHVHTHTHTHTQLSMTAAIDQPLQVLIIQPWCPCLCSHLKRINDSEAFGLFTDAKTKLWNL